MASMQEVPFFFFPVARAHARTPREIGLRTCEQLLQRFGVYDGGIAWVGRMASASLLGTLTLTRCRIPSMGEASICTTSSSSGATSWSGR